LVLFFWILFWSHRADFHRVSWCPLPPKSTSFTHIPLMYYSLLLFYPSYLLFPVAPRSHSLGSVDEDKIPGGVSICLFEIFQFFVSTSPLFILAPAHPFQILFRRNSFCFSTMQTHNIKVCFGVPAFPSRIPSERPFFVEVIGFIRSCWRDVCSVRNRFPILPRMAVLSYARVVDRVISCYISCDGNCFSDWSLVIRFLAAGVLFFFLAQIMFLFIFLPPRDQRHLENISTCVTSIF